LNVNNNNNNNYLLILLIIILVFIFIIIVRGIVLPEETTVTKKPAGKFSVAAVRTDLDGFDIAYRYVGNLLLAFKQGTFVDADGVCCFVDDHEFERRGEDAAATGTEVDVPASVFVNNLFL